MRLKEPYHEAIDGMRTIAILAVVAIHTSTRILEASNFSINNYPFTFFINQIVRFAVPLFFLISGFVLEISYSKHTNYFFYIKRRLSKIIIPYLFWSGFYYVFVYTHHSSSFLGTLLDGSSSYQLYFIPTLFIFYSIFPLLHRYLSFLSRPIILSLLFVFQLAILTQEYYVESISLFYPFSIFVFNFLAFLLGIVGSRHIEKLSLFFIRWKLFIYLSLLSFGLWGYIEASFLYTKTQNYLYFYTQWRPSIFLYSIVIALVLYFLFQGLSHWRTRTILKITSQLSFFVFFIHVWILELFWNTLGKQLFASTHAFFGQEVWFGILFFCIVAVVSYFIAYTFHKLRYLKFLTG